MNNEKIFFSLIIPVYNEQSRLDSALDSAFEYLRSKFVGWEVIYVDDGSTDDTYQKLLNLQASHSSLRVLRYEKNRGKGYAVRKGLEAAEGAIVLFSDADFSTPIQEASKLLDCLESGFDGAIGSRGLSESNVEIHQPWIREATGKAGNFLIRTFLPLEIADTQCGFKMFRREALKKILPGMRIDGFAFDIELLTIAVFQGLRIAEVPVTWRNVLESKVRPLHSLEVLRDLFQIRYRMSRGDYS